MILILKLISANLFLVIVILNLVIVIFKLLNYCPRLKVLLILIMISVVKFCRSKLSKRNQLLAAESPKKILPFFNSKLGNHSS